MCVCSVPALPFGKGEGTLEYLPTGEVIGFGLRCNPTESIMADQNPTCDIRTYVSVYVESKEEEEQVPCFFSSIFTAVVVVE